VLAYSVRMPRSSPLSWVLFLLLASGCGEFAPTVTLVDLRHETAVLDVTAPEGSRIRSSGTEAVADASGHAVFEISVAHFSEAAGNPEVSIFVDEDALIGARSDYLRMDLPLPLDVIQNLATEQQGYVFLPQQPGTGLRVSAVRGATIEVLGRPVPLDEWGVGPMVSDLRIAVLGSPPSLLARGGTLSVPATLTIDGAQRSAEAPLAISAAGVEGQLDLWLDRPFDARLLANVPARGLTWRRTREPLEPTYVVFGAPAFLGTHYAATETTTSTELRRCPFGAPLISVEREVVIRDMTTGREVARRAFGPGRIACPPVFSRDEREFRYMAPHETLAAWIETELAGLEPAP
jgi:hypothetical protein